MGASCPHCSKEISGFVPETRFKEVNDAKNAAEAQAATAQQQIDAATQAQQAALQQAQQNEATLAATQAQFQNYTAVTELGYSPALVDGFVWEHSRLPEENRPALNEWIAGLNADPSKAPPLLAPHLTPQQQQQQAAPPVPPPMPPAPVPPGTPAPVPPVAPPAPVPPLAPPPPAPAGNLGTMPTPQAPSPSDPQAIMGMSTEQYKAQRDSLLGRR
jgi:hypothetical protein